jgi:hypothetical protein
LAFFELLPPKNVSGSKNFAENGRYFRPFFLSANDFHRSSKRLETTAEFTLTSWRQFILITLVIYLLNFITRVIHMKSNVATRSRRPGRHYPIADHSPSLAFEIAGQPYVDRSAMSARAVISTATIDRVGDVLVPLGCRTENFAKNPVVLWAHGLEGIAQPIGTSRGPDGALAVTITKDDVQATSWFSQSSLETPIKSRIERDPEAGEILIVEEWELEEWSWCAVGVNPDAVAKALHRNRLGGRPMTQSIVKSLLAVAPTLRRFGVGLSTEKTMSDETHLREPASNTAEDDSLPWDGDDIDRSNQPYGATVIAATHAALVAACRDLEEALGPLENPTVKDGLQEALSSLQEQTVVLEGLYTSSYPDQPELATDDESDQNDEAMKSFLESGRVASLQVLGLGARLKGMIGARNLTVTQRKTLATVTRQLARCVSQAKEHQAGIEDPKMVALQKSIGELIELVGQIKK